MRRRSKTHLWYTAALVAGVLLLPACRKDRTDTPNLPQTVTVVVEKYVKIPPELTQPCEEYAPNEQTYSEAKRLALLRLESIQQCNRDKAKIRALGED